MKQIWRSINYLISTILGLAAVLTMFGTWSPVLFPMFNSTDSIPQNAGFEEVPMRAVGVNYPAIWLLGLVAALLILIVFLLAKRKKISRVCLWINGMAILIILGHIIVWIVWIQPGGNIL